MAKRDGRKSNIPLRIAMVLLCLVLATTCWNSGLQARYKSEASGSDSARVAKFDVDINEKNGSQIIEIAPFSLQLSPADNDGGFVNAGNMLAVSNHSEVAVRLTFDVTTTGNLPLEFQWMYKSAVVNPVAGVVMAPGEIMQSNFLQLQARFTDNSYDLHREIDMVTVTITCTQVD